jgi:hypothetical protein
MLRKVVKVIEVVLKYARDDGGGDSLLSIHL